MPSVSRPVWFKAISSKAGSIPRRPKGQELLKDNPRALSSVQKQAVAGKQELIPPIFGDSLAEMGYGRRNTD